MMYRVGKGDKDFAIEGKAQRPVIAFVKCYTGFVGSESTEAVYFGIGEDVDEAAMEMARENAQSHGYEGSYECPECGNTDQMDAECEDCCIEMRWEENDGVQGCAYQFVLSDHSAKIGGFHWSEILNLLVDAGAAVRNDAPGDSAEYRVERDLLFGENGLFNDRGEPEKEWAFFVEDAGNDGIKIVEA